MAWEPAPGSHAGRDRAAFDFAGNLIGILDLFDALRAADLDEPPTPKPGWWDEYITRAESNYLRDAFGSEPCPRSRREWVCNRTRESIGWILGAWDRITGPLVLTEPERNMVRACHSSLRNLKGILDPAQARSRWRLGVIPAEWHLDEPLPEVWEPGGESKSERQARERVERLEAELAATPGKAPDELLKQQQSAELALAKATQRRIGREYDKEMAARERGLVSPEVREQRESDREDWRVQVIRWKLGESDVRQLAEHLMAAPDTCRPGLIRFTDSNELIQTGPVPMTVYLTELTEHVQLFLAMLSGCERDDAGGFSLLDSKAGYCAGIEVVWQRVERLSFTILAALLDPADVDTRAKVEMHGIACAAVGYPKAASPLADTVQRLGFLLVRDTGGKWVSRVSPSEAARLLAVAHELTLHRVRYAKSEGLEVSPTPSVSLQDFRHLLERVARRQEVGAGLNGQGTKRRSASGAKTKTGRPKLDAEQRKQRYSFARDWVEFKAAGRAFSDLCESWGFKPHNGHAWLQWVRSNPPEK